MITERDLLQAIYECEQEPITATKIGKLADLYIIHDHLFGCQQYPQREYPEDDHYRYISEYSGAPQETVENQIDVQGDTEFLQAANGKSTSGVLMILDELMEATKILHPRMYDQVLSRLNDL